MAGYRMTRLRTLPGWDFPITYFANASRTTPLKRASGWWWREFNDIFSYQIGSNVRVRFQYRTE